MAISIFLLLDCLGLVFLIYALANFWNEGRRQKDRSHRAVASGAKFVVGRIAVIPQVAVDTRVGNQVILFPAHNRQIHNSPEAQRKSATTIEMREGVVSEQRAGRAAK